MEPNDGQDAPGVNRDYKLTLDSARADSLSQKIHFSQKDAEAGHVASGSDSDHELSLDEADTSKAEAALKATLFRKRIKTGCLTCRKRRIRCGEERPICKNCIKSKRHCEGYSQRVKYHAAPNGGAHITFSAAPMAAPMMQMQSPRTPYMLNPNAYSGLVPRHDQFMPYITGEEADRSTPTLPSITKGEDSSPPTPKRMRLHCVRGCLWSTNDIDELLGHLGKMHCKDVCFRCWALPDWRRPSEHNQCVQHCVSTQCLREQAINPPRHVYNPKLCAPHPVKPVHPDPYAIRMVLTGTMKAASGLNEALEALPIKINVLTSRLESHRVIEKMSQHALVEARQMLIELRNVQSWDDAENGDLLRRAMEVAPDALPQVQNNTTANKTVKLLEAFKDGSDASLLATRMPFQETYIPEDFDTLVKEDRQNDSGSSTAANPASTAIDDTAMEEDDLQDSVSSANGLSGNAEEMPLPSQRSAAIFKEAQMRIERLLVDLQYFEDDTEDDLSAASGENPESYRSSSPLSSKNSGSEVTGDGHEFRTCPGGGAAGSKRPSGNNSLVPGAGDQEQGYHGPGSGHKKRRIDNDNDNEDRSRPIVKTTYKKPASGNQRRLVCCLRHDPKDPCAGTDEHISDVLRTLARFHKIHICKKCWVLLETNEFGNIVHPTDCVVHCLSPRCHESEREPSVTPIIGQRHLFDQDLCKSNTTRPRPGDRELIYRFIFGLVHPNILPHEQPANVLSPNEEPHVGMKSRQGKSRPTRDELVTEVQGLKKELEELHKLDLDRTEEVNVLGRKLTKEQTTNTHLGEQNKRLQDIIVDALQPDSIVNDALRLSLRRRFGREAPEALDMIQGISCATAPSLSLQTPPGSLPGSQPSTVPTPNYTGIATQGQSSREISLQAPSNDAAGHPSSSRARGKRAAQDIVPGPNLSGLVFSNDARTGTGRYATAIPPSQMITHTGPATIPSQHHPALAEQWPQNPPSGAFNLPNSQPNINPYEGYLPLEALQNQAWTTDDLDENMPLFNDMFFDERSRTMQ